MDLLNHMLGMRSGLMDKLNGIEEGKVPSLDDSEAVKIKKLTEKCKSKTKDKKKSEKEEVEEAKKKEKKAPKPKEIKAEGNKSDLKTVESRVNEQEEDEEENEVDQDVVDDVPDPDASTPEPPAAPAAAPEEAEKESDISDAKGDLIYLGSKDDTYFYVKDNGDGTYSVLDQEDEVISTSSDFDAEIESIEDFIIEAIKSLDADQFSSAVVLDYILPKLEEEEEEEEEIEAELEEEEEADDDADIIKDSIQYDGADVSVALSEGKKNSDCCLTINGHNISLKKAFVLENYGKDGKLLNESVKKLALHTLKYSDKETREALLKKA